MAQTVKDILEKLEGDTRIRVGDDSSEFTGFYGDIKEAVLAQFGDCNVGKVFVDDIGVYAFLVIKVGEKS